MWLAFFLYTAATAAFVQLILLPYLLPGMHYGHGMFVKDSWGFHYLARDQAAAMIKFGWKAWRLCPAFNYFPVGIASIFYYLWYPEPFSLIPFNAVLHASAGCLVFFLISSFVKDRIAAFSGAALFVINPASLEWTSQIHRDGTFILGNMLVLSAWLLVLKGIEEEKWRAFTYAPFTFFLGAIMIWAPRPYWKYVVTIACIALAATMFIGMMMAWFKGSSKKFCYAAAFLSVCLMLVMQQSLGYFDKDYKPAERWDSADAGLTTPGEQHSVKWRFTPYVPKYVESKLYVLAVSRFKSAAHIAGSNIDSGVNFEAATDFITYLPRALQIGFLSPFPSMWFTPGSSTGTTVGRAVLGVITMFFYMCLVFFCWSILSYGKNRNFRLIVLYCTFGLLVFTYVQPNIGTLVRFRYGFYMPIVSIGFAFMVEKLIRPRPVCLV